MNDVFVDSNILLDIATADPTWSRWSTETFARLADEAAFVVNALIYTEVSVGFARIEDVEGAFPRHLYRRDAIPWEAAFLAAKCFVDYRRRGGMRTAPLPDFFVGAHAAVAGLRLLTRDAVRYRTYFPTVELIAPDRA